MYKTEYGSFDGNSWEAFCQTCFKLKYESNGYQELTAWQGDLGIEGFTRDGIVFQCYCPDEEYEPSTLYEKQRDKITKDLKKLDAKKEDLKKYLKDTKIKKWIFVTPGYKNKELVKHCRDKADEYRAMSLEILDSDFDVFVQDLGFFAEQIPYVVGFNGKKVEVNHIPESKENQERWKNSSISLVQTANRKNTHRVSDNVPKREEKINKLTSLTISHFLNGNLMLGKIQTSFPDDYEKFVRIISQYEEKVEEMCITNSSDSNTLYDKIAVDLKAKIASSFPYLDEITIERLTNQVLADWILRCPIEFE
ncbi:hypothetical protein [Chryseobacterium sp. EO14]|uniref:hypothetical protein n=1 Tax=Chryseobacterium sp. EO14 TaxID=2950551 RepID=UPI00210BD363|nr:hypothetical protein [Chryseobacterium sp. EO14]MCQ4142013.1 hypothetical protein [Chryseobacterium sp. EO14]